jgi:hypothetical protein
MEVVRGPVFDLSIAFGRRVAPTHHLSHPGGETAKPHGMAQAPPVELSPRYRHILSSLAPSIRRMRLLEFGGFRWMGSRMLSQVTEASYLARFFTKFVEIVAGGLATAMCAYLIAHVGDSPSPAPTPVLAAPAPGEVVTSPAAKPAPPLAPAVLDEQLRAAQPVTNASAAQPARKAERAATAVPAPKDTKDIKSSASAARSEKSVEALARAALANLDADRPADGGHPASVDAPARRNLTGVSPAVVEVPQRPADVPPSRAVELQPPSPAAVETEPRPLATVEPLPPNASSAPEVAAQPQPHAVEPKGLLSFFKQMPDLLRPGSPSFAGEAPRPPLPVGAAASE